MGKTCKACIWRDKCDWINENPDVRKHAGDCLFYVSRRRFKIINVDGRVIAIKKNEQKGEKP